MFLHVDKLSQVGLCCCLSAQRCENASCTAVGGNQARINSGSDVFARRVELKASIGKSSARFKQTFAGPPRQYRLQHSQTNHNLPPGTLPFTFKTENMRRCSFDSCRQACLLQTTLQIWCLTSSHCCSTFLRRPMLLPSFQRTLLGCRRLRHVMVQVETSVFNAMSPPEVCPRVRGVDRSCIPPVCRGRRDCEDRRGSSPTLSSFSAFTKTAEATREASTLRARFLLALSPSLNGAPGGAARRTDFFLFAAARGRSGLTPTTVPTQARPTRVPRSFNDLRVCCVWFIPSVACCEQNRVLLLPAGPFAGVLWQP